MAERVGHQRELAPGGRGDGGFELCTGVERVLHGGFDVAHDEIEAYGGPMTLVGTEVGCGAGGGGTWPLEEEVNGAELPSISTPSLPKRRPGLRWKTHWQKSTALPRSSTSILARNSMS